MKPDEPLTRRQRPVYRKHIELAKMFKDSLNVAEGEAAGRQIC
jgi:hypothetical protein